MTNDDAQLHERDWQFMLDSIYRINTTSSVEKLQYETLSCLRSLTPSYQGTFSMIKMDHGIARSSRPVIVGAPAHLIEKFTDNYDEDPYYDGLYLKTASYAFRDRDMIPEDVRESSPSGTKSTSQRALPMHCARYSRTIMPSSEKSRCSTPRQRANSPTEMCALQT